MKILLTGGSGFIGTNLIERLFNDNNYELLNIDIVEPKIVTHRKMWRKVDLCNADEVKNAILEYMPDYVIALAARTDLKGKTLESYEANMGGVSNILSALEGVPNMKRMIYASSMYVCEPGYIPKDFEDYAPHTLYGESKVITEKIIKTANPSYIWSIIRPTSIWGPWFGEPYNNFFKIVLKHLYFHMGKRACKKTYGYVDNAIYQIMSILNADSEIVNRKVFYLGDYEPYDITKWANEIAEVERIHIPHVPYWCFKLVGKVGDCFKKMGICFPMTSFRLHNMTTDNIHNLEQIRAIAPNLPVSREEGTKITLKWMHETEM